MFSVEDGAENSHVRQRVDHFRDELVRTLADGDAALVDINRGVRAPDAPA